MYDCYNSDVLRYSSAVDNVAGVYYVIVRDHWHDDAMALLSVKLNDRTNYNYTPIATIDEPSAATYFEGYVYHRID